MAGKFKRPPELEAEWKELGSPSESAFWERLSTVKVETVIAARRHYRDAPFVDRIDEVLVNKIDPMIRSAVRRVAGDEAAFYREEMAEVVIEAFWREVLQGEDTFYEIRCSHKLHKTALDARRKVLGGGARSLERQAARIGDIDDMEKDPAVVAEEVLPDSRDDFSEIEEEIDWFTILASMPPEVATAIDLHYRADLKVHSNDPDELTVTKVMGCSERKARELIRVGEEIRRSQILRMDREAP